MIKDFFRWIYTEKKKAKSLTLLFLIYLICRMYVYMEVRGVPFKSEAVFGGYFGELGQLPWGVIIFGELLPTFALVALLISYFGMFSKPIYKAYK